MADLLRDLWPVWLFFTLLGWVGEAVSARLIYWQQRKIDALEYHLECLQKGLVVTRRQEDDNASRPDAKDGS